MFVLFKSARVDYPSSAVKQQKKNKPKSPESYEMALPIPQHFEHHVTPLGILFFAFIEKASKNIQFGITLK